MIVLDSETTGLDSRKHSIVSIGAVDFENPSRKFYGECRIWAVAEITQEALNINGFTREQVTKTNEFSQKEILENFLDWADPIKDRTIAGENVGIFDLQFLKESFSREGLKYSFGHRTIEVHTASYLSHIKTGTAIPLNKNRTDISLDTTLRYVGLPPEPKPHNALTGALLETESLYRLMHSKPLFEEYKKYDIPLYLAQEHR